MYTLLLPIIVVLITPLHAVFTDCVLQAVTYISGKVTPRPVFGSEELFRNKCVGKFDLNIK